MRIAVNDIMIIDFDALPFQALTIRVGRALTRIMGDNDRRHHEAALHERFPKTQHIFVVRDTQVLTHFIALDIIRRDNDNDLQRIAQLGQHAQFGIRHEAG